MSYEKVLQDEIKGIKSNATKCEGLSMCYNYFITYKIIKNNF